MATDDDISWSESKSFYHLLNESLSTRRRHYDREITVSLSDISDSSSERLYSDDGTRSTSIGSIIDTPCTPYGPISEIIDKISKEPLFLGSLHDTRIEIGSYTLRKERYYMDIHEIIGYR
jgi:hypothetical protein